METYFDLIPTDLSNIIVSYLNSDDLENFGLSHTYLISIFNWSFVHSLHFGSFTIGIDYTEYLKLLQVEKLIKVLHLRYTINQLLNLQELYLINLQLKDIPKEIGDLSNLQMLNLKYNQLIDIPKEIGMLASLQRLDLSNNKLKNIPEGIYNLRNLQYLYLSSNYLTNIPKEIGMLESLQRLDLRNNKLMNIPKEIEHLRDLNNLQIYI